MKAITIIGAGAVGRSIALALFYGGVKIDSVYSLHGRSARTLARKVKARTSGPLSKLSVLRNDLIICVPDTEIDSVTDFIDRQDFPVKGKSIVHTSGAVSSNVLLALKRKGASIGSFHPMQTFPKNKISALNGMWIAAEGDAQALKFVKQLAKIFKSSTFTISKEAKVLYHTAGVFASNYVVTLLSIVEQLAAESGIRRNDIWKIYGPILHRTLENVISSSPAEALTGPIARGDVNTVVKHLDALSAKKLEYLVPLYSTLGIETARLARKKNKKVGPT